MNCREHDREILAVYHKELQACGVSASAYSAEQLYRDFRLGLMTASQHPAFAAVNLYVRRLRIEVMDCDTDHAYVHICQADR